MLSGLLLTIGATCLLYLSGLFVLWTPLPMLYWYHRKGGKAFVIAALLCLFGLSVLYHLLITSLPLSRTGGFLAVPGMGLSDHFGSNGVTAFALLYFVSFALIAGLLGRAHQRRDSINRTFFMAAGVPVLASVVLMALIAVWGQIDLLQEIRSYLMALLDQVLEIGGPEGMSRQQVVFLKEHREAIATTIVEVMPSALLIGSLLTVWCNVIAARWWFPQKPMFQHLGPLCRWKLGDRWVWLLIGAGAAFFLDLYIMESRPLALLAINVLWVLGALYFLQGLAVLSFWVQKRQSIFMKAMAYGLLILFFQVMALVLAVLGIFDIWFDFRRMNPVKA